MGTRRSLPETDFGRGWLVRGIGAGAGAMILAVTLLSAVLIALMGDGISGWGADQTRAAIIFTLGWSVTAAGAGAVGAWQAAEGGASHASSARLAGVLGPVTLIVLITAASIAGGDTGVVGLVFQAIIESTAAAGGATLLARRLDAV